jgi:hypothetical protein
MEGPSLWDTTTQGVIPRTIDKLFQAISEADVHTSFTVSVSYYEVFPFEISMKFVRCIANEFAIY